MFAILLIMIYWRLNLYQTPLSLKPKAAHTYKLHLVKFY